MPSYYLVRSRAPLPIIDLCLFVVNIKAKSLSEVLC